MPRKTVSLVLLTIASLLAVLSMAAAAPAARLSNFAITPTLSPSPVATEEAAQAPTPLVMLTMFDPWRMVIGSDSPTFVLYDDGQVIYQQANEDGELEFVSVLLSSEARDDLFASIVPEPDAFFALENYYDPVLITDQPMTTIRVHDPVLGNHVVSVVGIPEEAREGTPEVFFDVYDAIIDYEHKDAEPWLPDYFEVFIWEYDTSNAVEWHDDFPDLADSNTIERGDSYSLYLPIEDYPRFAELTEDASAIRMNGETWVFITRYPFPHEFSATSSK